MCDLPISNYELVGRNLTETPSISKTGIIKDKVIYPKLKRDSEPGRGDYFTNKLSVTRLCRYCINDEINLEGHAAIAGGACTASMTFRGYLVCRALQFVKSDYHILPAPTAGNPYHAHVVIGGYNVPYRDDVELISDVLPKHIAEILDRIKMQMKVLMIFPSTKYPAPYNTKSNNPCSECHLY